MKYAVITLCAALMLLISCECPPEASTSRIIYPENFAKAAFFNAVYSGTSIDIATNYGSLLTGLYFGYNSDYTAVGSGTNVINLLRNSATLYSVPVSLMKDSLYTMIFYGNSSRDISVKILEDGSLHNLNGEPALRLVNAEKFDFPLSAKCSAFDSIDFPKDKVTEFRAIPAGIGHVAIYNGGVQLYNFRFSAGADSAYTFVVSYSPAATTNKYGINISMISVKYKGK